MFLVTTDGGTHEFTKVFYQHGKYNLQGGTDRLGPYHVVAADLDRDGCTVRFSGGHLIHIPRSWYQLTYLPGV